MNVRRSVHVPELDGVRGIAIAGVMALHFVGAITATNLLERITVKAAGYGVWGVDLFFVLSGFLITGILYDSRTSVRYLRDFYMRRALRIFPLYYAVLVVVLVMTSRDSLAAIDPQFAALRGLQGWIWPYFTNVYLASQKTWSIPYVSHFWSLAVEEHFYLVWPFVILACSRTTAMRVCIGLAVFSLVLRTVLLASAPETLAWQTLTPCRFDALCAGGWFALRARDEAAGRAGTLVPAAIASGAGVIVVSLWHLIWGGPEAILISFKMTLLAIFFGVFIAMVANRSGLEMLRAGLRAGWLTRLGKYSYGLYVYHGIVAYALHRFPPAWLFRAIPSHSLAAAVQVTAALAISLMLAVASFELFEKRFLALKRRFDYSNRGSASVIRPGLAVSVSSTPADGSA